MPQNPKTPNIPFITPPKGIADQQWEEYLRFKGLPPDIPKPAPKPLDDGKKKLIQVLLDQRMEHG